MPRYRPADTSRFNLIGEYFGHKTYNPEQTYNRKIMAQNGRQVRRARRATGRVTGGTALTPDCLTMPALGDRTRTRQRQPKPGWLRWHAGTGEDLAGRGGEGTHGNRHNSDQRKECRECRQLAFISMEASTCPTPRR